MKSGNKEELNRESGRNHLESEKWFKSGLKYAKLGQPKEATEHFEEAVWLDPNNHKIHFNLGTAYLSMGFFEQALINFSRAIDINPKMSDAYGNRAVAHAALSEDKLCEKDRLKAIKYGAPPDGLDAVIGYVKDRRKKIEGI